MTIDKTEFDLIREYAIKKCESRKKVTIIGCVIILAAITPLLFFLSSRAPLTLSILLSLPIILFALVAYYLLVYIFHPARTALAAYRAAYKKYVVYQSLDLLLDNLAYFPDLGLPRGIIQTVMTTGDRFSSNDYIAAKYKGISLVGADVHTEREHRSTDSNGHTTKTYTTIFKGKFFIFDFNRDFAERLQLVGKSFAGAMLSYSKNSKNKYRKIETESVNFNNSFTIYSQNGQETFYILDPAFMEKLQVIADAYKDRVLFSFMDKKLIIAVNDNSDAFEPPHPKKFVDETAEFGRVNKEIISILQFIDVLMLDRYMFKGKKWKSVHGMLTASAPFLKKEI